MKPGAAEPVATERPFVDFYRSLDISPVKQDITDLQRHFQRRESLYRFLGIPSVAVRGARVIEFGPGSGFNALYTASLGPSSYTLVDGNPRGIAEMRRLFRIYNVQEGVEIVESLIEEFKVGLRYDLVLAEGIVVFQRNPADFARRIAEFAKPGGLVVVTCSDAVSILAEVGRRLIAQRIAPPDIGLDRRMEILCPLFRPHLATLAGMSRSVEDWVLDNIVQPLNDRKLFSVSDAISALESAFDVYGSSPRFLTDWRWYKEVVGRERQFNAIARRDYEESLFTLLDCRFVQARTSVALGRNLSAKCEACFELMQQNEKGLDVLREVIARLEDVVTLVSPIAPRTAASVESLCRFLGAPKPDPGFLEEFTGFFGRGMQYLSFVRRAEEAPRQESAGRVENPEL